MRITVGSIVRTPDGAIGEVVAIYVSANQASVALRDLPQPEDGPWPYLLDQLEPASPGDAAIYRERSADARSADAEGLMSAGSPMWSI